MIISNSSEPRRSNSSTIRLNRTEIEDVVRLLTILPYPVHPNGSASLRPYWDGGLAVLPAAQLAVEHVNQDPNTLTGYRVELLNVDGGCDIFSKALMNFAEHVLHGPPVAGIIGPGCDHSALAISSILGREETALPNVHLASSPLLGDRSAGSKYKNSYGIRGLSHTLVETAISLINHNKWDRVAALFDPELYVHLDEKLRQRITEELRKNRVVFLSEVYDTYLPIDSLMKSSAKVIILFTSPPRAMRILCIAYGKRMLFPVYQWVVTGYHFDDISAALNDVAFHYDREFYNCSSNKVILQNSLLISHRLENIDKDTVLVSGHTYNDIHKQYLQMLSAFNKRNMRSLSPNILAAITYDAVWALVMAINMTETILNSSISISNFQYGNTMFTDEIKLNLDKIDFNGASGFINFDSASGYTHRVVEIIHINSSMDANLVGFTKLNSGDLSFLTDDSRIFINTTVTSKIEVVHPAVAAIFLLIILSLSTATILLHIVSTVKRKHPSIKASSHILNHFIFTGCYIWTAASIIYIIVLKALSSENEEIYANCCHAVFAWLLPVGWTLIFGTLITKTWRIYKIFVHFRDPGHLISNEALVSFVLLQLGLDIALGMFWSILSPAQLQKTNKPATSNLHNTITAETYLTQRTCVFVDSRLSHLFWILIVLGYKALQVSVLLTFTVLTRNIKNLNFSTFLLRKASYLSFILFLSLLPPFIVLWYSEAEIHIDFILLCTFISGTIFTCFIFVLLPPALPVLKK